MPTLAERLAARLDGLLPLLLRRLGPCSAEALTVALPFDEGPGKFGMPLCTEADVRRWLYDHPACCDHTGDGWIARATSPIAQPPEPPAAVEPPRKPAIHIAAPAVDRAPAAGRTMMSNHKQIAAKQQRMQLLLRTLADLDEIAVADLAHAVGVSYAICSAYCHEMQPLVRLRHARIPGTRGHGRLVASLSEEHADAI